MTDALRPAPRRIWRVTYRAKNGKLVRTYAKVPYAGVFGLTETMTRALAIGDIDMYRLDAAKPKEITPGVRSRLQRWPDALRATSERSGVTWNS
jgi:hypothetical protein